MRNIQTTADAKRWLKERAKRERVKSTFVKLMQAAWPANAPDSATVREVFTAEQSNELWAEACKRQPWRV